MQFIFNNLALMCLHCSKIAIGIRSGFNMIWPGTFHSSVISPPPPPSPTPLARCRYSRRTCMGFWGAATAQSPAGRGAVATGRTWPPCASWPPASAASAARRCRGGSGGSAQRQRSRWRMCPVRRHKSKMRTEKRSWSDTRTAVTAECTRAA